MKSLPRATNCESWAWLHELEKPSAAFWNLLSQMGKSTFEFHSQAVAYAGTIDLEQAFLSECGHFLTTQPSLNLASSAIEKVYLREAEASEKSALEVDFKDRKSLLRFPDFPQKSANLVTNLFGWEMKPETPHLAKKRRLAPITVCRCCAGAAKKRRAEIINNPLGSILSILASSGDEVVLTLHSPSINLVTPFCGEKISTQGGCLIAENDHQTLHLDVGQLHGLRVMPFSLDQCEVIQLSLFNSHGSCFASIASYNLVHLPIFQSILQNAPEPYQYVMKGA